MGATFVGSGDLEVISLVAKVAPFAAIFQVICNDHTKESLNVIVSCPTFDFQPPHGFLAMASNAAR